MRYIAILLLLGVTLKVNAQQINPVPDYIFRNQMSVGRNAPTDTAAYMSIGPRYGANKGLMPPMVVDTNAVTGTKRNGLLIFSVQLNNFAYWDSTTSRFRQITAQAVVDSLVFATRAWRKKGDDSLGAVIAVKTDTALLSTKAYRQKGVDSLVTLISTLGGGTVLSVGSGYGTNFSTITTSGSVVVDSLVITSRASRDKLKDSLNANIALKVNISDTSTMLGAYLRKADTTAMLSPYLRKGDTATMLSPYVRIAGYGLLKGTQTLSVDSATIATRARVQKGIDSVASLVAAPDSLLFSTRAWRQKGDDSLGAIIGTKATATGTTNYLSKFTGTSSLGNSIVYATTSEVGISTPSPTHPLDVNGRVRVRTIDSTASPINFLTTDNDGVIRKTTPFTGTVTSVATGFGLSGGTITTTGTLVADTNSMATRARVQKAVDSLNVNIAAKGSGTVTSVSAGTGMSFTTITSTGSVAADTTVLSTRAWRQKGIDSVANLSRVTGSGTTNYVPKFTGSTSLGNSLLFDNGSSIGINTTSPLTATGYRFLTIRSAGSGSGLQLTDGTMDFRLQQVDDATPVRVGTFSNHGVDMIINSAQAHRFHSNGRFTVGGNIDNGSALNVIGSIHNTTGAVLAATSGDVGIGTASASEKLHVNGKVRIATIDSSASPINMLWADVNGVVRKAPVASGNVTGSGANGQVAYWTGTSSQSGENALFWDATNDRLGIGTTGPGYQLQINGTDASVALSSSDNISQMRINVQSGLAIIETITNTDLRMRINSSEKMRLTTGGELLIGTTTDAGDYNLQVAGAITNTTGPNHLNTTSGNTGIGLSTSVSPSEKLHVNGKVRIATIDSSASPINMLWADVNGVVRKAPVASGGLTGTGTTNYLPKWTSASALGNSAMYDSSGFLKTIANVIGNGPNKINDSKLEIIMDGLYGYPIMLTHNDSLNNASQLVMVMRKGLLTSDKPRPGFGVGLEFQLQNDAGTWIRSGYISNHIVDSTAANYQSETRFTLRNKTSPVVPLRIFADSSIRMSKLAGTGSRYVLSDTNGNITAPAFDSTGNAINMLYAGTDGVIRKAPVPASSVAMSTDEMTAASGWTIAYDKTQAYPVNDVNKTVDGSIATVTINTAAYRSTATFNTDQWVHVATVPSGFRPDSDVYFSLPNTVDGGSFRSTSSVAFTSYNFYQEETAVRVLPNGNVEVYVGLVSNSADLSGANYVIMPIAVTYNIETYPN
jgi:hypothetical protein